jgi:hypothetical protein
MNRTPVESSNIADVGYDSSSQTLEVGFLNGTVYQYFDVPPTVHQELMSADSHGKYFSANIKNHYRFVKL